MNEHIHLPEKLFNRLIEIHNGHLENDIIIVDRYWKNKDNFLFDINFNCNGDANLPVKINTLDILYERSVSKIVTLQCTVVEISVFLLYFRTVNVNY